MPELTHIQQLQKWVDGESIHRGDLNDPQSECCPDFSCCNPEMKWPREKRVEFAEAYIKEDEEKVMSMLVGALGGLADYHECRKTKVVSK